MLSVDILHERVVYMKKKETIKYALKLWSSCCLVALLSIALIPVEQCISYPIHSGWIIIFVITVGCSLGILISE